MARLSDTVSRGARRASGDRRRDGLHAGARQSRSGQKRRARQSIGEACIELASKRMKVKREWRERFKGFHEHDRSWMQSR
jgi:hypothetical protein